MRRNRKTDRFAWTVSGILIFVIATGFASAIASYRRAEVETVLAVCGPQTGMPIEIPEDAATDSDSSVELNGECRDTIGFVNRIGNTQLCVILGLSLMSVGVIVVGLERFFRYLTVKYRTRLLLPVLTRALAECRFEDAVGLCSGHVKSHVSPVVGAGLQTLLNGRTVPISNRHLMELVEDSMKASASKQKLTLRKRLSILANITAIAPLLGLFGTVVGLTNALQGMQAAEGAGIGAVAGGISEALCITGFSLIVGVTSLWLFKTFQSTVERFEADMRDSAFDIVKLCSKREAWHGKQSTRP